MVLYAAILTLSASLFTPFVFIKSYATDRGIDDGAATALVGFIGAASVAGRLALGSLGARLGATRLTQLCFVVLTLSFLIWLAAGSSYAVLVAFTVVMGVAYGGFIALTPAVAAGLFGTVGLGAVLGALYTAAAVGGLVGPPVIGADHRRRLLRRRDHHRDGHHGRVDRGAVPAPGHRRAVASAAVKLRPQARALFALTALVIVLGLIVQLFAAYETTEGYFSGRAAALNAFCYFTTQSNVVLAVGCALLAAGFVSRATWFRALRMIGVVGIALTFVVYQFALRGLRELTSGAKFADVMLHTVSPILGVLGWLLYGPRRLTSWAAVGWTTGYVAAWGLFTMIRGAILENADGKRFYPYPFMNAQEKGYPTVIVNLVIVGAVFFGLAYGAFVLDGVLTRRRHRLTHQ